MVSVLTVLVIARYFGHKRLIVTVNMLLYRSFSLLAR